MFRGYQHVLKNNPYRDAGGQFTTREKNVWQRAGHQLGSNEGGQYLLNGAKVYAKFPNAKGQITAEVVSDKIHEMMGVRTMNHQSMDVDGREGSVSAWKEVSPLGYGGWSKLTDAQKQDAANAYVAAALTKNWDVVGLEYDNMGVDKEGRLAIMDTGGSFMFRAQGEPKPYTEDPTSELEGMLDRDRESGRVFSPLMKSNRAMFVRAARKLQNIPDSELTSATEPLGKEAQAAILGRKKAILSYFGI